MNYFKIFFRGSPSDFIFESFGSIHFLILLIGILGLYYIYKNRAYLKDSKKLKKGIVEILFIQQLILYIWYISSDYFSLGESLPLYNCRFAIICLILGESLDRENLKYIGVYWGIFGSIVALLVPVVDPFGYNHYTFYSFFLGHLFLLWGGFYILVVERIDITKKSCEITIKFTTIYHLIVLIFNNIFTTNYCYLISPPLNLGFDLNSRLYSLLFIILFNISIYLIHLIFLGLIKRSENLGLV